jgi:hypothetical protein
MKKQLWVSLVVGFALGAQVAAAGTEQLTATYYFLGVDEGEVLEGPNGGKFTAGLRSHGHGVSSTGEIVSIWCDAGNHLNAAGQATVGVGYCRQVYDNGDWLWVSFTQQFSNGVGVANWTVVGGTGKYEGATGSGTTTDVSQRGDGRAWASQAKGTIKTK